MAYAGYHRAVVLDLYLQQLWRAVELSIKHLDIKVDVQHVFALLLVVQRLVQGDGIAGLVLASFTGHGRDGTHGDLDHICATRARLHITDDLAGCGAIPQHSLATGSEGTYRTIELEAQVGQRRIGIAEADGVAWRSKRDRIGRVIASHQTHVVCQAAWQPLFGNTRRSHILGRHLRRFLGTCQRDVQLTGRQITIAIYQLQRHLEVVVQLIEHRRGGVGHSEGDVGTCDCLHFQSVVTIFRIDRNLGSFGNIGHIRRTVRIERHRIPSAWNWRMPRTIEVGSSRAAHDGQRCNGIQYPVVHGVVARGFRTVIGIVVSTQNDCRVGAGILESHATTLSHIVLLEAVPITHGSQIHHIVNAHGFTGVHPVIVNTT